MTGSSDTPPARTGSTLLAALGIFLFVAAAYVLSSPGRVDMIDGQLRYEVARSLLEVGKPLLRDGCLHFTAVPGQGGEPYSAYSLAGCVTPLPLVGLALALGDQNGELARFLFSLTSPLYGALAAALLFFAYSALGMDRRRALAWTGVFAFATLAWPTATSSFDQSQHAFFLLLALFLAHRSARAGSTTLAFLGGLAGAVALNFQESYALILPVIGFACLAEPETGADQRAGWRRYVAFGTAAALGLVVWMAYNAYRFGSPLDSGKVGGDMDLRTVWGNPLAGLLGLTLSPGKSVFLYSPPLILALLGLPALRRRHPRLGSAVAGACIIQLALTSTLAFYGGDWCWGPRYIVPVLPLLLLAAPFFELPPARRWVTPALATVGVCVQLLGLSLDHHVFFFQRRLPDLFWAADPWYYFRPDGSQLLARPGEILRTAREGLPAEVERFAPSPHKDSVTWCPFGTPARIRPQAPQWMRRYAMFHLPRPWPLWMPRVAEPFRPVNVPGTTTLCIAVLLCGALLISRGVRLPEAEPSDLEAVPVPA